MTGDQLAQQIIDSSKARTAALLVARALRGKQLGVRKVVRRDSLNLVVESIEVPFFECDARASDDPAVRALAPQPPKPMREPWTSAPLEEDDEARDFAANLDEHADEIEAALWKAGADIDRGAAEGLAALNMASTTLKGRTLDADCAAKVASPYMSPREHEPERKTRLSPAFRKRLGLA